MSNGNSLVFRILIILIIFLIIYLVTSFIFMYLIKSNKIKPGKVSRIFYIDDEKFIKNWEKNRKKGYFLYSLYNLLFNSISILAPFIIYAVITGSDFNLSKFCWLLTGNIIGSIIGLFFRWNINEEKYYKLLNNK